MNVQQDATAAVWSHTVTGQPCSLQRLAYSLNPELPQRECKNSLRWKVCYETKCVAGFWKLLVWTVKRETGVLDVRVLVIDSCWVISLGQWWNPKDCGRWEHTGFAEFVADEGKHERKNPLHVPCKRISVQANVYFSLLYTCPDERFFAQSPVHFSSVGLTIIFFLSVTCATLHSLSLKLAITPLLLCFWAAKKLPSLFKK